MLTHLQQFGCGYQLSALQHVSLSSNTSRAHEWRTTITKVAGKRLFLRHTSPNAPDLKSQPVAS